MSLEEKYLVKANNCWQFVDKDEFFKVNKYDNGIVVYVRETVLLAVEELKKRCRTDDLVAKNKQDAIKKMCALIDDVFGVEERGKDEQKE